MSKQTIECVIVDDNDFEREVLESVLKSQNFSVRSFGKSKEALGFCNLTKPSLLMLDWFMPELNGLEFLKAYKQADSKNKSCIVMCSSNDRTQDQASAIESGAHVFLTKPVNLEDLFQVLRDKGFLE